MTSKTFVVPNGRQRKEEKQIVKNVANGTLISHETYKSNVVHFENLNWNRIEVNASGNSPSLNIARKTHQFIIAMNQLSLLIFFVEKRNKWSALTISLNIKIILILIGYTYNELSKKKLKTSLDSPWFA